MKAAAGAGRVAARRTFFAASALALLLFALLGGREGWGFAHRLWWLRCTGWSAAALLLLSLCVTPVRRLLSRGRSGWASVPWGAFRRAAGITAASFALLHAGLALTTYLWSSWSVVVGWPYLRAGLTALAILLVLLLTSFPRLVALTGVRLWKPLHRLSYVAALFLLQHLLQSPFAPRRVILGLFAGVAVLWGLRFLPPLAERARRADWRRAPSG